LGHRNRQTKHSILTIRVPWTMTCNGDLFLYLYRTTGSKFACESKFKISNGIRFSIRQHSI